MQPIKKNIVLALLLAISIGPMVAKAGATASIYNGIQREINGLTLVQDSNDRSAFYYLPKGFRIATHSGEDFTPIYEVIHDIYTDEDGHEFSSYTMTLKPISVGDQDLRLATLFLRRDPKAPSNATVVGPVQICGLRLGVPGFADSKQSAKDGASNPNAQFIQYNIDSDDISKCNSRTQLKKFTLTYRVPISMEPMVSKSLTSQTGLVLPPVQVILPTKYQDSVVVEFDANSSVEQLKAAVGFTGTIKLVTIKVDGSIESLVNKVRMMGGIHRDCQNLDQSICDGYVKQAAELLSKLVLTYLPLATSGDTNPLVVADNDKSVSGSLFKIGLAADYQSSIHDGKFRFDFTNMVYDITHGQAQLFAAKVPEAIINERVRKLWEKK